MNRRTAICLLAAATLAACGQPPSPGTPLPVPTTEISATAAISTTATSVAPLPTTTTTTTPPPKPPPPPSRTTTTKPPPPPPKPPDRWVLPAALRGSIESRTAQPFPETWAGIQTEVAEVCPGQVLCVGHTLVIVPSGPDAEDCFIVTGGISLPDPLHEGGKITFRVTNDLCSGG